MDIEWRSIPGFEGEYEVSNSGLIRSVDRVIIKSNGRKMQLRGKVLKYQETNDGYYQVTLGWKHRGTMKVHRCVALAFIPNENNYRTVNHKDGNKHNNVENLEWMTDSDNLKHAYKLRLRKPLNKPIRCVETGKEYISITEAAKLLGGNGNVLSTAILRGNRFKGYHFEHINKT